MSLSLAAEAVPLTMDSDGIFRVGSTRVTLDTVVLAFEEGATAEEIVQRYPTLTLADTYAVLAYFLRRPDEVREYLSSRARETARIRAQNEARFDPEGLRDRLLARRAPRA